MIDRQSAKIVFISSTEGGVDIESVAKKNPEKIVTTKINYKKSLNNQDIENIIKIFRFDGLRKKMLQNLFMQCTKLWYPRTLL